MKLVLNFQKKKMKKRLVFFLMCLSIFSCDDELTSNDANVIFDGVALLTNTVDNHILPEYRNFNDDVSNLVEAKNTFVTDKTEANLQALRAMHLKAYDSYQPVAKYSFGKAQDVFFNQNLNAHPFNLSNVDSFILNQESEASSLTALENQDRQGFPAVDYLINGLASSDAEIVAFYTGSNALDYTQFLSNVIDRIQALTGEVIADWEGSFRNEFISDSGFLSVFVNSYINYFERRLRASKIGLPAGRNDGEPSPEQIESVFDPEESRGLLITALESSSILYEGLTDESDSLSRVLRDLGEEGLDARIKLEFIEAQTIINTLNPNLALQVNQNNNLMLETRDELQDVVQLLKLDLTSALNIAITFQDNDGD